MKKIIIGLTFAFLSMSIAFSVVPNFLSKNTLARCGEGGCAGNGPRDKGGSCFPAGTKVTMANGVTKNIEDVAVGDQVISQSESGNKSISTVTSLDRPVRDHMCSIGFIDGQKLDLTSEHPMFTTQGWKSINPTATLKENPTIQVSSLATGDKIAKSDGSYDQIFTISCRSKKVQTYNLLLDNGSHTYFAGGFLAHNKGENLRSCFPAGTKVTMADGANKNIEDIKIKDQVMSQDENGKKSISTVAGMQTPIRDNMCSISFTDGEKLELTNDHPIFTRLGWKSISPLDSLKEAPTLTVGQLNTGDMVVKEDGSWQTVSAFSCQKETVQTYNLLLENGAHTYFAGGFLAHNKTTGNICGPHGCAMSTNPSQGFQGYSDSNGTILREGDTIVSSCFPAGTKVLMGGGDQKNIEDVKIGDQVISQSEAGTKSVSTVSALDQPVRDHMCQINFEDGDSLKLTNEHPLFTKTGWKAIAPRKEDYADPNLIVKTLSRGDAIIKSDGSTGVVRSISCWSETVQAYNLILSGASHTYFADGYLAHNKGGSEDPGPGGDPGFTCSDFPVTLTVTNGSPPTKATITWSSLPSEPFGESVFAGTDKAKVDAYCPNGIGPGTGCAVSDTNIAPDKLSYTTGDVLSPGTVYYWKVFFLYHGITCLKTADTSDLTSCGVSPDSLTLLPGESETLTTDVKSSPEIGSVVYTKQGLQGTNANFVSLTPTSVSNPGPFSTAVKGLIPGSGQVTSSVKNPAGAEICSHIVPVTVNPPPPWWQVGDSDVLSGGNLASQIPLLMPQKYFGLPGYYAGGFPGVPAYSGDTNLTNANASTLGWLANSGSAASKVFDYAYFANQIPSDVVYNPINQGDVAGSLENGGTQSYGYYWYKYDGSTNRSLPLILPTTDIKDRKVILLVNSADLDITGNINLNNGVGFFMAIVGKSASGTKGNIVVDPAVGGSGPNLEGIYVAGNSFSDTGGALKLHVRGSVVAYGGVQMLRNLGDAPNADQSSEFFEYAPDQIMLFPTKLGTRRINWKEVAP